MISVAPTVFVVDDDPSVTRSLNRLLQSAGYRVETFTSAREFLERRDNRKWGCLVLDIQLPELTGLELQQMLPETGRALSIVFITGYGSVPVSVEAMKRGAADFLEKPLKERDFLQAVEGAIARSQREYKEHLVEVEIHERMTLLTPREYQVLCGVVAGKLNKQIAADLQIGEKTVKVHRGRVMKKMGVRSVASLVQKVGSNLNAPPATPSPPTQSSLDLIFR